MELVIPSFLCLVAICGIVEEWLQNTNIAKNLTRRPIFAGLKPSTNGHQEVPRTFLQQVGIPFSATKTRKHIFSYKPYGVKGVLSGQKVFSEVEKPKSIALHNIVNPVVKSQISLSKNMDSKFSQNHAVKSSLNQRSKTSLAKQQNNVASNSPLKPYKAVPLTEASSVPVEAPMYQHKTLVETIEKLILDALDFGHVVEKQVLSKKGLSPSGKPQKANDKSNIKSSGLNKIVTTMQASNKKDIVKSIVSNEANLTSKSKGPASTKNNADTTKQNVTATVKAEGVIEETAQSKNATAENSNAEATEATVTARETLTEVAEPTEPTITTPEPAEPVDPVERRQYHSRNEYCSCMDWCPYGTEFRGYCGGQWSYGIQKSICCMAAFYEDDDGDD